MCRSKFYRIMLSVACFSTKTSYYQYCYLHWTSGDHLHELVREVLSVDLVDVEICNDNLISLQSQVFYDVAMHIHFDNAQPRPNLDEFSGKLKQAKGRMRATSFSRKSLRRWAKPRRMMGNHGRKIDKTALVKSYISLKGTQTKMV
jgi:hypothetical protein